MSIPYDLYCIGEARLRKRGANELRELCSERGIDVDAQAEETVCVDKLLKWKIAHEKEFRERRNAAAQQTRESPADAAGCSSPSEAASRSSSQRRGGNINSIGAGSSDRVAEVLEPHMPRDQALRLADEIIQKRELNGDYTDWQDLCSRVEWLVPEFIEALDAARFTASARGANNEDDAAGRMELRRNVSPMKETVWRHRRGKDIYTQNLQPVVEAHRPQVDHVFELQLFEYCRGIVYQQCSFRVTRGMEQGLCALVNGFQNLNVTTESLNQKKKGPIMAWRNQADGTGCAPLEDFARRTQRELVETGTWGNIQSSIVQSWEESHEIKEGMPESNMKKYCESVLDQGHFAMEKMQIF